MKKTICILGSTGSIGTTTLKIILDKKKLFEINTLVANKNFNTIIRQIRKYKPKNFVINDKNVFDRVKKKNFTKTKIHNNLNFFTKGKKIDLVISAIPGLAGLEPTIKSITNCRKILLANKESIICGWDIIVKLSKKNNVKIVPIDSEHFSITKLLEGHKKDEVEKIYLTASGGPFFGKKINLKNITPHQAIKHPKWSMGKKISIDSSNMMNKVFEVLEAQKLFAYPLNKFDIIIHPESLVHAIIKFKNGITKFLYHEPTMVIPISNALFDSEVKIKSFLNHNTNNQLKQLNFFPTDKKKFPAINLLYKYKQYPSTPIILNAANEILVDNFLRKKIGYTSIIAYLFKVLKDKKYIKYAIKSPKSLNEVHGIDSWTRDLTLKTIFKYKKK